MDETVSGFYDRLAEEHHWIFQDWNASIDWQGRLFGTLLETELNSARLRLLDCACGIGTQALGLARRGHAVLATDLSSGAVARARREAASRGLAIDFAVADLRDLGSLSQSAFDAVLAADNALPHLDEPELPGAARSIASKLRPGGVFVASIRDYDAILSQRPTADPPRFFSDAGLRRIVHQVWDWTGERTYTLHLYITRETAAGWHSSHHVSRYRAILRDELAAILAGAGFTAIRWLMPADSGFYQPLVVARLP